MAEAKDGFAWLHTAAIIAQLGNVFRGENDEWHDPFECCPWPRPPKPKIPGPSPEIEARLEKQFNARRS